MDKCHRILTALCALTTMSVATYSHAQDFFTPLSDGVYLGAQIGYDSYSEKLTQNTKSIFDGSVAPFTLQTLDANGPVGGALFGYGHYFRDFYYLGGEIFGNLNGHTVASSTIDVNGFSQVQSKITMRGEFGLGFLPGLKINEETLAYLRLGYNWTDLQYKLLVQNTTPKSARGIKSSILGGVNFGIGIESSVYENVSVRAEFSHTNYQTFYANIPIVGVQEIGNYYQTHIDPSDNQFMAAVIYHFT